MMSQIVPIIPAMPFAPKRSCNNAVRCDCGASVMAIITPLASACEPQRFNSCDSFHHIWLENNGEHGIGANCRSIAQRWVCFFNN
ncbi:MAG: hypothetical protein R2825_27915 [Saprospiraceae bacterium]